MSPVIEVSHISKSFGEIHAVSDLSFSVTPGEVYGFLGQNGAGKSTTIRMLLALVTPSAGHISIFGQNLYTHRSSILSKIGAIIEKPDLYGYLTALQNIAMLARISCVRLTQKQLMRQLDRVGLADRAHSKVKTFSQGMKQRLGIACALVHEPGLVILDEPTNGLDPQGIADMRNLLLLLSREEKRTVFVSSHLLYEIEQIADSMLIIDKGKKRAEGRVQDLLNPADTLVRIETMDDAGARLVLASSRWNAFLEPSVGLQVRMHRQDVPALARFLVEQGIDIVSIQPKHSLEDYFLTLTTANQHVAAYPH